MRGISSSKNSVSSFTEPSFQSHHMPIGRPLGKTMSIGGILPACMAAS
jgi:hypothetical protein